MKYKIIKFIPIVLFALVLGTLYIINEPINSLILLSAVCFGYSMMWWYDYFNKKEKDLNLGADFRGRR